MTRVEPRLARPRQTYPSFVCTFLTITRLSSLNIVHCNLPQSIIDWKLFKSQVKNPPFRSHVKCVVRRVLRRVARPRRPAAGMRRPPTLYLCPWKPESCILFSGNGFSSCRMRYSIPCIACLSMPTRTITRSKSTQPQKSTQTTSHTLSSSVDLLPW